MWQLATGKAQLLTVDSRVRQISSCMDDDNHRRRRWNQQQAGCSRKDILVPGRQTMKASVNVHSQLEVDVLRRLH